MKNFAILAVLALAMGCSQADLKDTLSKATKSIGVEKSKANTETQKQQAQDAVAAPDDMKVKEIPEGKAFLSFGKALNIPYETFTLDYAGEVPNWKSNNIAIVDGRFFQVIPSTDAQAALQYKDLESDTTLSKEDFDKSLADASGEVASKPHAYWKPVRPADQAKPETGYMTTTQDAVFPIESIKYATDDSFVFTLAKKEGDVSTGNQDADTLVFLFPGKNAMEEITVGDLKKILGSDSSIRIRQN